MLFCSKLHIFLCFLHIFAHWWMCYIYFFELQIGPKLFISFLFKIVLLISEIRRRGIFGSQPQIFCLTQLILNKSILLSNLEKTFQTVLRQLSEFWFFFYDKTQFAMRGLTWKKCLKMKEFCVNIFFFYTKVPQYFFKNNIKNNWSNFSFFYKVISDF